MTGRESGLVPLIRTEASEARAIARRLGSRGKMEHGPVLDIVGEILDAVRSGGDEALLRYTARFDRVALQPADLRVTEAEIRAARAALSPDMEAILSEAASNILRFHEAQRLPDLDLPATGAPPGDPSRIGLRTMPLERVGVYVPGGTAPLPSSVLMNVLPARAAGVPRIVMATPPRADGSVDPLILAAADIAGVTEIYRVGGAQAIAALAYGTAAVPAVDKICGPGNIYVNTAKRLVYGIVDIDLFAGPSEILVLADDTANPEYVAADMISQAEHDRLASAVLVTDSLPLALAVGDALERQMARMPRREILEASLRDYGALLVVPDLAQAAVFADAIAPEHLELVVRDPDALLPALRRAGAIFVGPYSPEPLGDYFAGPNHVLPTSGTARFFSPLSTADFQKRTSLIRYTREALKACARQVAAFADAEGLRGHAEAIRIRFPESGPQSADAALPAGEARP